MVINNVKQSKNNVRIVGTLVENSLKEGTYKNSEGKDTEYVAGNLIIRVEQPISGKDEMSEIPVNVWVAKYTKTGKVNPGYESMIKAMNNYISLTASGNDATATKVMITNGSLTENLYSADGDKVFSTPRFQSNFISSIPNFNNYKQEALFTTDIVVGQIDDEINPKDGTATGRLKIKGMICKYNGAMDALDFFVEAPEAINYIRSYWNVEDTVQISGKIRYTAKTEQIEVPTRFGDPVYKPKTTTCRELIITADSTDVLTAEDKYSKDEIKKGLEKRTEAIEAAKERAKKTSSSDTSTKTNSNNPYGF